MRVSAVENSVHQMLTASGHAFWTARICVKYRHGLDVIVDGLVRPVFISTSAKGLFPFHLVVSSSVLETLLDKPAGSILLLCTDKEPVRCDGVTLRMPSRVFDLHLRLGLGGVVDLVWFERRIEVFRRMLNFAARNGGLGAFEVLFSESWQHSDAFDVTQRTPTAIASVLGCGKGSTPAGDDMLIGAASACQAVSGVPGETGCRARTWLSFLAGSQSLFARQTTLMSCGYLNAALDGVFGSHLIALHKAFWDIRHTSLLSAMLRVKRHGSTSGLDTLAGVYLGYRFLTKSCYVQKKSANR